jgi:putative protease
MYGIRREEDIAASRQTHCPTQIIFQRDTPPPPDAPRALEADQPVPAAAQLPPGATIVRLAHERQWTPEVVRHADVVILPWEARVTPDAPWGVEIPRGLFGLDAAPRLEAARRRGASWALCGTLDAVPLARTAGLWPLGGAGLNVMNDTAAAAVAGRGVAACVQALEAKRNITAGISMGIFAYGYIPLMLTRICPVSHAAAVPCGQCKRVGDAALIDRRGERLPVMCAGACAEVLNTVPLYLADKPERWQSAGFRLLHFTVETAAEVARILWAHREGVPANTALPGGFTRGRL